MNQFILRFTEGLAMDWAVDDSVHSSFKIWIPKCENILEVYFTSLQDENEMDSANHKHMSLQPGMTS